MDTVQGPFVIFDWEQYAGYDGYCTGNDDISRTLDLYGVWEVDDWQRWARLDGFQVDFGAHIGWYATGDDVLAVEPDPENVRLLRMNTTARIFEGWSQDIGSLTRTPDHVKADVEGDEDDVIRIVRPHLPAVKTLLLECSPEFDDYYPDLIAELRSLGYQSAPELGDTQANVWFW